MPNYCAFDYKTCRKLARLTQEQAAELLHISRRSLSAYENMQLPISDDLVVAMAELYSQRKLVFWHLKHRTRYGSYLPDREDQYSIAELSNAIYKSALELAALAAAVVGTETGFIPCLTGDSGKEVLP